MTAETRQARDEALVLALARGLRVTDAATEAGVSPRTAQRRLQEPKFASRVQDARESLVIEVRGAVLGATLEAVNTLRKLLRSKKESVRLGAARALLQGFVRFQAVEGLAERVSKLEEEKSLHMYSTDQLLEMRRRHVSQLSELSEEEITGRSSQPASSRNGASRT